MDCAVLSLKPIMESETYDQGIGIPSHALGFCAQVYVVVDLSHYWHCNGAPT